MTTLNRVERLQAIKEEYARQQKLLVQAKALAERAEPTYLSKLLENDMEQAKQLLAAEDIMNKLQDMAEDLAKLHAQEIFPLVDEMKASFGPEAAQNFENVSQDALVNALNMVRKAKEDINTVILQVKGDIPPNDMATAGPAAPMAPVAPAPEMGAAAPAADSLLGGMADEFGGTDAAAGPMDEPLGRARKESREGGKALTENRVSLVESGRKLLERESLGSLMDWLLTEAASALPSREFATFARKSAVKAAENPEKMAGWIGAKKYGAGAMAQLMDPTVTAEGGMDSLSEGRTFKDQDDGPGDTRAARKADREFRRDRKDRKDPEREVDEGRTFKDEREDDEDFDARKAKKDDKAWRKDRAGKQAIDDKVEEAVPALGANISKEKPQNEYEREAKKDGWSPANREIARMLGNMKNESYRRAAAMGNMIEANILAFGKGKAAQVVEQFSTDLVESDGVTIMEAFQEMFGMKPAAFSVALSKQISEAAPLSTQDQKNLGGAMGKIAGAMASDKSAAGKPVSSVMNTLNPQERAAVQKVTNNAKAGGATAPKKVADLVATANAAAPKKPGLPESELAENINAAHWPVADTGQYKGTVATPDLPPLKAAKSETKSDAPKAEKADKAPAAEKAPAEKAPEEKAPAAEKTAKPAGNKAPPFTKKEEPKEEAADEAPAEEKKPGNPFAKKA
jgi:hypothetical protein